MAKLLVFEWVAVMRGVAEKARDKLLTERVMVVVAKDESQARMFAARGLDLTEEELDRVEIFVRPFAGPR